MRAFIDVFLSDPPEAETGPSPVSTTFFIFLTNCRTRFPRRAGWLTADFADSADAETLNVEPGTLNRRAERPSCKRFNQSLMELPSDGYTT